MMLCLWFPGKGNSVIGNDVCVDYDALIMPGVTIGDGPIISSCPVVVSDVPAYTIEGGNPATAIRQHFATDVIESLISIAWWNWSIEKITQHLDKIVAADVRALQACATVIISK